MSPRTTRWIAVVLAVLAADVGVWASVAPRNFYERFPGFGHHWVAGVGPYNEHLVRDVGGLYLAMTVLSLSLAWKPGDLVLARVTGLAWLVFSVPHLLFHIRHLDGFGTADKVGNVVALGWFVIAGVALLCGPGRGWPRPARRP